MATIDFFVTKYGKSRGTGAGSVYSSDVRISGQDSITTVENLEDGSGDITCAVGEILAIHSTAALRIAPGGGTAAGTTGIYIPANVLTDVEIHASGTVSVIEAA